MKEDKYLVISRCEDEPRVELLTRAELMAILVEQTEEGGSYGMISQVPPGGLEHWPERTMMIVRANFVFPEPVQKVTEWRIP